jgi:signal transduction histidine kinase
LIQDYIKEVEINIDGNKKDFEDLPQVRGPILTNSNIYKSPYFFRGPNDRNITSPTYFHELKRYSEFTIEENKNKASKNNSRLIIYFGSFNARRENKLNKDVQKAHIEIFFDRIEKRLEEGKGLIKIDGEEINERKLEFNTSLLVPLLRPAASFIGDKDFRLRGGGLFVYGNTQRDANHSEIVSRLQHFFYRNILNESHTQITVDFFRHGGTNDLIHDFKTFISSQVINGLEYILNENGLSEKTSNQISNIIKGSRQFITEYKELLEAYRDFIREDAKINLINGNDLKYIVSELNNELLSSLNIGFEDKISNSDVKIKANEKILKKIFRNLISNTLS